MTGFRDPARPTVAEGDALAALDVLEDEGGIPSVPAGTPLEEVDGPTHEFVPAGAPLARCAECGLPPDAHPRLVSEDVVTFLYLLLRDEVPAGKVESIVQSLAHLGEQKRTYSTPELEALARRYAAALTT